MRTSIPPARSLIGRIVSLMKRLEPAKRVYLREQLNEFERLGQTFRTVLSPEPPSQLVRRAEAAVRNPASYLTRLKGPQAGVAKFLTQDSITTIILFHYEKLNCRKDGVRNLGEDGGALKALLSEPNPDDAFRYAAEAAVQHLKGLVANGKGGRRRRQDNAIRLAGDHILSIYETVTSKKPGVSVRPGTSLAVEQIRGRAVEFLLLGLELMGFHITRATARRLIDEFRRDGRLR